jgi:hypothetical protein
MGKNGHDKVFIIRDGQSQKGRFPDALRPYFAKVDDRGLADFLEEAKRYASELNYYDSTNTVDGDWAPFFDFLPTDVLTRLKGQEGDCPPHVALFVAFLLLMRQPQKELNRITDRHLDFYYRKVLGLTNKAATPDKVHVVFELKKGVHNVLIEKGTLLKAGKDRVGKDLYYGLEEDTLLNRATVADLRAVRVDPTTGTVLVAPKANSTDGLGAPLDRKAPFWDAFGTQATAAAELGFAVASPVLLLSEGTRKIDVSLVLTGLKRGAGNGCPVEVLFSGPKGWFGPKEAVLTAGSSSAAYSLSVTLSPDDPSVVPYTKKHGGNFATAYPMMQVLLKRNGADGGYRALKHARLSTVKIDVDVRGIRTLILENDLGTLDPSKPFMPFGVVADKESAFYVGFPEVFGKKIKEFSFDIRWKVPDDDLATHYAAYKDDSGQPIVTSNVYFTTDLIAPWSTFRSLALFGMKAGAPVNLAANFGTIERSGKTVGGKRSVLERNRSKWTSEELGRMERTGRGLVLAGNSVSGTTEELEGSRKGFVEFRLNKSFLHREYRDIYTTNIVTYTTAGGDLLLPKEPYTPVMKSIGLNYRASTGDEVVAATDEPTFIGREVEFFHLTAFGQMREDGFLRRHAPFSIGNTIPLLPQYLAEGEFYIGVKDIEPLKNLSLFVQVSDGSGDPSRDKVQIAWSVLCDNYWRPLSDNEIIADQTTGFLKSGIMRFVIPDGVTTTNTVLPDGLAWLRATILEHTDAVCKLVDVRANGGRAVFVDRDNDPVHLSASLPPNSVSELVSHVDAVKTIEQPFASFGGATAETQRGFYTRVSERLRHKNRAVTMWDWERLVLARFPSIYKVKCIGHTSPDSLVAPGHVTVIVVPDTRNKRMVDPLRPKVDKEILIEIETFLKARVGMFCSVHVENPAYVQIRVAFGVVFRRGFEFGYYRDQLNKDIVAHLTPWARDDGRDVAFGGQIHKSTIVDFVEDRPYVDYVTRFRMFQGENNDDREVIGASEPRSVLVSAEHHAIEPV